MISTLTLTEMSIDPLTVKIIYLANIIGSDIGSLLLPIGTLATLIWMHIIRQHGEKFLGQNISKRPLSLSLSPSCLPLPFYMFGSVDLPLAPMKKTACCIREAVLSFMAGAWF